MPWILVIIVAIVLVVAIFEEARHHRYRRSIYARPDARTAWAELFPDAMPTVEGVLAIFCDAFMFNRRYAFRFRPEDTVMQIYKGTTGPVADEMQTEILCLDIDKSYGVDIADFLREDLTLRDLVEAVVQQKEKP